MPYKLGQQRVDGRNYLKFLGDIHEAKQPQWYLEVGTQTGKSLLPARANCIAVDPNFALKHNVMENKKSLHLFQEPSDDFFQSDAMKQLAAKIDLAFLDGMHLFDFLLRDFINTEKYMNDDGIIVMHDCLPFDSEMAQRDRKRASTRAWCGDVWKVVPILKKYRPKLKVTTYDAEPTGLVVVENLDPKDTTLSKHYDDIMAEFMDEENVAKYVDKFTVTPTSKSPWPRSEDQKKN